eukprot:Selendium_serpulae@DN4486_c0_g1_i1.p1
MQSGDNDQKMLTAKYLARGHNIVIDSGCTIFQLWRGKKAVEWVNVGDARKKYPYKRPYYTLAEKEISLREPLPIAGNTGRKEGEFMENDISKAAGNKVLVDVKAESVPCVLHIHCRRNVDFLTNEMKLSPMKTSKTSTCWYCWYSFKGHLADPVTWWWALIALAAFFLVSLLAAIGCGVGALAKTTGVETLKALTVGFSCAAALSFITIIQSILYVDRPRGSTRPKCCWPTPCLLPPAPIFFVLNGLGWLSTIIGAMFTIQQILEPTADRLPQTPSILSGYFLLSAIVFTLLIAAQSFNRCCYEREDVLTPLNSQTSRLNPHQDERRINL